MKNNWQIKKLGEVCDIGAGNSAPQKKEFFIEGKYPFFRTSDVGTVHIGKIEKSVDYLNDMGIKKMRLFSAGTLLFPKSGASTFLNHRVMMNIDGYVSSHLSTIEAKDHLLDNQFLFYFSLGIDSKTLMQDQNYPSLRLSDIESITIPFPSIEEQKRIVKILDEAFEKIEKAKKNAEKNLQNTRELSEAMVRQELTEKDFEKVPLYKVCTKQETYNPTIKPNTNFKYIDISSIDTENFSVNINKVKDYIGAEAPSRARKKISKNDILFSTVRPNLNRNAEVPEILDGAIASTGFTVIKPDPDKISPKFLSTVTCSGIITSQVSPLVRGAAYPAISDKDVFETKIPLPPIDIQNKIAKKLNALLEQTKKLEENYKKKLEDLEELKKSILKKAFEGEL